MLKLLIVDDEVETREGILERLPWNEMNIGSIEQADNGVTALKKADGFKPDIVLTDVRMPRMDGVEMSIKLRELFPDCKIIFMSGYSDKEYLKSAIQVRAVRYVEKPINLAELKQSVEIAAVMCLEERNKKKIESEMNDLVKTSIPLFRSELAVRLATGRFDPFFSEARLKKAGIDITPDCMFVCMLLKFDTENEADDGRVYKMKEEVQNKLEGLYRLHNLKGLSALYKKDCFIIHLYCKTSDEHLFTREKLLSFCDGLFELPGEKSRMFISVGKKVRGLRNIAESYKTSVIALQKAFFTGYGRVVFYEDNNDPPYDFNTELIGKLTGLMMENKKEEAVFLVKRTMSDIKRYENTLIGNINNFCYNTALEIEKLAKQQGFSILQGNLRENLLWERILKIGVIYRLEDFLISVVDMYFSGLKEANEKNDPVFMVMKYIQNNYHRTDLSVNTISEYVHLAPTYICNQFKCRTGKTINRYITGFRLEKARELLENPEIKISKIASMIGLSDGGYFTKIFRKSTGLTPSEYRERNIL